MLSDARQSLIKEIAIRDGEVIISKVSKELGVSLETVRRDINSLCKDNILEKVHGGAIPLKPTEYEDKYIKRKSTNETVKKELGDYTCNLLSDSKTIFLSSGTTVEAVANFGNRLNANAIITNSIPIAESLSKVSLENKTDVILLGGKINSEEHFTYGSKVLSEIRKFHTDIVVISAVGIDESGAMCASSEEGSIVSEMINSSSKVILVADSSKFGKKSVYRHCPIEKIDYIVTDNNNPIPEKIIKNFKKHKIIIDII